MDDDLSVSFRPGKRPASDVNAPTVKQTDNHAGTSASDLGPSVADNAARNAGQSSTNGTGAFTSASATLASEAAAEVAATVAPNHDDSLNTVYFRDGKRSIDFVLAYEKLDDPVLENRRVTFEKNLLKEGLELELEDAVASRNGKTNFLKVHAPWEVLISYAEKLHLRMPIKKRGRTVPFPTLKVGEGDCPALPDLKDLEEGSTELEVEAKPTKLHTLWARLWTPFSYDKKLIPDEKQFFTAEFVCEREPMYLMQYKETFFSQAIRSRIAWEVLMRTAYEDKESQRGIHKLLNDDVYLEAYPLHDGPIGRGSFDPLKEEPTERRLLYSEWARPAAWYKQQPLGLIRRYFGEKTGLYFAWLGFYTSMLFLPAALGLLTTLVGVLGMTTNTPTTEVCDRSIAGDFIICPACNTTCPYEYLHNKCANSRMMYIFDNGATVGFAIFMALWATIFMELWKRRQSVLALQWNLNEVDRLTDVVYPEYEAKATLYKLNPVTMIYEPYVPAWEKVARIAAANSVVLVMLCLVVCSVFAIIAYRIITLGWLSQKPQLRPHAHMATAVSASLLNLVVILLMNKIYRKLARRLTEIERPRTQREYEDSFTFKMFLFTFLNTYSSLIYIAFFKGRFATRPGQHGTLFGYSLDKCDGVCLYEVTVQLAIVMVGKQVVNNIREFTQLRLTNRWRSWQRGHVTRGGGAHSGPLARWEEDYVLAEWSVLSLFDEYLEMVIQFGFVTLFVAAFPLAPLFALLNNIVEIRLDAYKYTSQMRRPLAERVPNIGAWQVILKGVSTFAVICNAFQIAYTSDFIPRLVYRVAYSGDFSMRGFVNFSLSSFDTSDFDNETRPDNATLDGIVVRECRYRGYREPPGSENEYQLTLTYWHIFAARLIFVVLFEHVVFFITGLVAALIPDVPQSVQQRIRREQVVAQNLIAGLHSDQRAQSQQGSRSSSSNVSK
ncbi:anoctamin-5-like [Dermacentor albipictus]|uniref:anoctamin-5-like n=1 Tax=Dermacentor albipictus TaxID=60249 RepID=UPI0031FC0698